jgi:hypothetical protein
VTIHEGDFLGVFAGEIRYSELFDDTHGIRGPCESIWLDYGRVSGTLNLVRVTMDEDEANVYVFWEPYREDDGSPVWRVSVRAPGRLSRSRSSRATPHRRSRRVYIKTTQLQGEDSRGLLLGQIPLPGPHDTQRLARPLKSRCTDVSADLVRPGWWSRNGDSRLYSICFDDRLSHVAQQ